MRCFYKSRTACVTCEIQFKKKGICVVIMIPNVGGDINPII